MKLLVKLAESAVEGGALVGVFAVAQVLRFVGPDNEFVRQILAWLILLIDVGQVQRDRAVVGGGARVHLHSQFTAELKRGFTAGGNLISDPAVVGGIDHHGDALVVFRSAAEHRRAADVDVLDGVLKSDVRLGHSLLERVEVYDDEIDRPDAVFGGGGGVFVIFAQEKQAAMDHRVQRLDATVEHLGETGVVAQVLHLDAALAQRPGGAAGRDDFYAGKREHLGEGNKVGLVGNGNERALNLGHDAVAWVAVADTVSGLAMFASATKKSSHMPLGQAGATCPPSAWPGPGAAEMPSAPVSAGISAG